MLVNDLSYYVDDELVHLIGSKKQQPLRHQSLLHLPAASTLFALQHVQGERHTFSDVRHRKERKWKDRKIDANYWSLQKRGLASHGQELDS